MFYCREAELSKLNKRYKDGEFECIVIYPVFSIRH